MMRKGMCSTRRGRKRDDEVTTTSWIYAPELMNNMAQFSDIKIVKNMFCALPCATCKGAGRPDLPLGPVKLLDATFEWGAVSYATKERKKKRIISMEVDFVLSHLQSVNWGRQRERNRSTQKDQDFEIWSCKGNYGERKRRKTSERKLEKRGQMSSVQASLMLPDTETKCLGILLLGRST